MPEHTSWFTLLLLQLFGRTAIRENMEGIFGRSMAGKPVGIHSLEALVASGFIVLLCIGLAYAAREKLIDYEESVIPDDTLTLRTFFELFIGYFYDLMKDMMGAKRAKRYFGLVGTCAVFVFFSNFLGLIPGFLPPTATWNITMGAALVVFAVFNYYGFKENGFGYVRHLAGPYIHWAVLPINFLLFFIELISTCIRPLTLSIRLMLNMAVDHMLLGLFMGLVMLFVPVPLMVLGTLVALIQTIVFAFLAAIYIALATEHEEHAESH